LEAFPERVDVGDLVAGLAEQQARDPEHPEVSWRGDPGPFFVDATRLRTALLAFDEALGWWAGPGPIDVTSAREGDALVVAMSRDGSTIGADDAEDLFQPRRPGSGGGSKIGLYVVRGVARALGGDADAHVADGRLHLRLSLPLG
jgi:C4-dicarboxylate-specific signal transduction histidine kinase